METFGVLVIGAGPGGYPAAIHAAQMGATVALIEKEELGGACLNWGCIPFKTLIASSSLYAQMKSARNFGINVGQLSPDYAAMINRKDDIVRTLGKSIQELISANKVKIFRGTASFHSRNQIALSSPSSPSGTETTLIGAERTIIATGAQSSMPTFLPRHGRVVDSRAFFDLKSVPQRVLILGGGVIGCELACMLAQLDVQVTIVELLEDILSFLDSDVRGEVRRHMENALGIRIICGGTLENISADNKQVRGTVGEENLEADLLLAALGRKPATDGLRLENAGLTTSPEGFIEVDEYGRTQVATIYAIGDVTGGIQLAHAATSQGLVAAENACSRGLRKNEKCIPNCIFTSPEVGTVGISQQQSKRENMEVKVSKFKFAAAGKALANGHTSGFVKWVADVRTGQLLGAQAVGEYATELISEATTAIRAELTVAELGRTVHAHPTLSEAWMEAAHILGGKPVHMTSRQNR